MIVIAEFCSNIAIHDWNFTDFCEAAARAGATDVKIQLYKATHFPTQEQSEKRITEFPRDKLEQFATIARAHRLKPGASCFDFEAIDLCERYLDFIKLATREERSFDLLLKAHMTGLPIYRSIDFRKFQKTGVARTLFDETILGCIPEYPTKGYASQFPIGIEDLPRPFGWSSHTRSFGDVETAVIRGATVIEKHLALSRDDPEAGWSLLPDEFKQMVERIKRAEDRRYSYYG